MAVGQSNPAVASTRMPLRGFGTVRAIVLLAARTCLLPLASAAPLHLFQRSNVHIYEEEGKAPDDPNLYVYLGIAAILVLLGGAFAGLTIALMGQDETYLYVIAKSGEGRERSNASRVLKLLNRGKHWVLVTLLLGNVITNETLPIVLDRSLGGGWPAVLASTVLIVIFGEIAPQSVCVRYGLQIGAFMAPLVMLLMYVLSPIAWPTAKLLDWLLGADHGTTYKKAGLKTLVQLHKTIGETPAERLLEDEVNIINSVLDLKEKSVGDIMTPMQDVFIMSADTVLDERMMDTILSQGYSRIPVYSPDNNRNFIGMLLVKILITYDPEDCKRVRDFALATLPETGPYTSCLDIINFFQEGKSHMVLVSDFPGQDRGATGVVTLEDVIEELIGEEIIDESDVFIDVHKAIRRLAPAPKQKYRRSSMDPAPSESEYEGKEDDPLLAENKDGGSRNPSANGNTTFMMRRKSSNNSDTTRDSARPVAVPIRSNTTDMRQHLRHLGPSNAASKPRATKFTSVKIKPGVGTIPEGKATTTGDTHTPRSRSIDLPSSARPEVDEVNGLLKPPGQGAAETNTGFDGGYGTMSTADVKRVVPQDHMSASEASHVAEEKASSPTTIRHSESPTKTRDDNYLNVPNKLVIGSTEGDDDTVGEMEGPTRQRSKSRRARSGSITETEVNVGGMKKVVLETTSSSSDVDEQNERQDSPATDEGEASSSMDEKENADNNSSASSPKKDKKRGKRRKGGKGSK